LAVGLGRQVRGSKSESVEQREGAAHGQYDRTSQADVEDAVLHLSE
jgi:hypothetical protein